MSQVLDDTTLAAQPLELLLHRLRTTGEGAPGLEEKRQIMEHIRARSPAAARRLDETFLRDNDQLRATLIQEQERLHEMKRIIDTLTSPPWHTGIFLGPANSCDDDLDWFEESPQQRVAVFCSGRVETICLAEGVDLGSLAFGDDVFLSTDGAAVLGKCSGCWARGREEAAFQSVTPDGQLMVSLDHRRITVDAVAGLDVASLKPGDLLLVDRQAAIAYKKLADAQGQYHFVDEVPAVGMGQVGGQHRAVKTLHDTLMASLVEPEIAKLYGVDSRRGCLLYGPPGNGKTLLARIVCAEISRITGRQCRFAVVKPAEWWSPWVGETEANIRRTFQVVRRAAEESGMAMLFLDELSSIGRTRGSMVGHHSDRFLSSFLAEMQGFEGRGNVAVVAADNRIDLVDPAVLERFDVHIPVPRPDMRGAREIFEIHMAATYPFSPNGDAAARTRSEIIDRAVSRLYAPNAGNDLYRVKFRDNSVRTVAARELMSGRLIEQICQQARRSAFLRHAQTKEPGIRTDDMDEAVSEAMERLSGELTRENVHSYLSDLPQDMAVASVEPVARRVRQGHRYLNPTASGTGSAQ